MFYDAANPSILSEIDTAILQRYIWVPMIPTTYETTIDTTSMVLNSKLMGNIRIEIFKNMFISEQRFIQLCSYEMSKLIGICSHDINQTGALHVIKYVLERLKNDMNKYGCLPIQQRSVENIISLAKCHCIRRNIIKNFFFKKRLNGNISYDPKRLFTEIIEKKKLYIKFSDIAISFGQLSSFLNIFITGELAIITAFRYIFIRNLNKLRQKENTKKRKNSYVLSKKNINYIEFPKNPTVLSQKCFKILNEIWSNEELAILPLNCDMLKDTIIKLFLNPSDNRIQSNYILDSHILEFIPDIEKLFPRPEEKKTKTKESIFFVTKTKIFIHVMYLTRLHDPTKLFFPWTNMMPDKWSPSITEDVLLKWYLSEFLNFKSQQKKKNIVFKLLRKRKTENSSFSNCENTIIASFSSHDFDILTKRCIPDEDRKEFKISLEEEVFNGRKRNERSEKVSLTMNIDRLAKLSITEDLSQIFSTSQENNYKKQKSL